MEVSKTWIAKMPDGKMVVLFMTENGEVDGEEFYMNWRAELIYVPRGTAFKWIEAAK